MIPVIEYSNLMTYIYAISIDYIKKTNLKGLIPEIPFTKIDYKEYYWI